MPDFTPKDRDVDADYRKAITDDIALRESLGLTATPHQLQQLAELDVKGSLQRLASETPGVTVEVERKDADPAAEKAVPAEPTHPEGDLERKDVEPPVEKAVPAKPAPPTKPSDDASAAGS